jgi:peptide/nickel transport system ATP-binding protein
VGKEEVAGGGATPILRVKNLVVTFTKNRGTLKKSKTVVRAVDDVSFDIYKNEIVSLVGESGSGKTTIARAIMSLVTPDSGSITFNELQVSRLGRKELLNYWKDVQFVFQDPFESLNPRFDVFTTLSISLNRLTGETDSSVTTERVHKVLGEVGLDSEEVVHKFPHQLSGGERQRVNIAHALIPNPKLLIADEPITMLDASQRLNMLTLLMQLRSARHLTILMITHDLASALMTSDRTMVMYLGKVVETGPTRALLASPHHPYAEMIIQATPRLKRPMDSVDSTASMEESEYVTKGCVFRPRCSYATEICREVEPGLLEKSKGRFAACHNALSLPK